MATNSPLESILHHHGYSLTTSRQTVFDALQNSEALTMHELVSTCPKIDRASVYRTVSLFERLGIVQRLQTGWKYKIELAGVFHSHHHHATCQLCGQTFVAPEDEAIEVQLRKLAARMGFQLEKHQLELQGYCTACQELLKD